MDEARSHYEAAISIRTEVGNRRGEASFVATWAISPSSKDLSTRPGTVTARHSKRAGMRVTGAWRVWCLATLGNVSLLRGELDRAEGHSPLLSIAREVASPRDEAYVLEHLAALADRRGRLGEGVSHLSATMSQPGSLLAMPRSHTTRLEELRCP